MQRTTKIVMTAGIVLVAAGAGTGMALVSGDDHGDTPITGPALERASAVALDATGGGRVTGTEVDDEESKYQVEVTLSDGRQVDVQLDDGFDVVGRTTDGESSSDGR
jgi:hypothetical protein